MRAPNHPKGYVKLHIKGRGLMFEHRVVMEEAIGRRLETSEIVHHKNEIRNDNRIENLEIMTRAQHQQHHMSRHPEITDEKLAAMIRAGAKNAELHALGIWQHQIVRVKRAFGIPVAYRKPYAEWNRKAS